MKRRIALLLTIAMVVGNTFGVHAEPIDPILETEGQVGTPIATGDFASYTDGYAVVTTVNGADVTTDVFDTFEDDAETNGGHLAVANTDESVTALADLISAGDDEDLFILGGGLDPTGSVVWINGATQSATYSIVDGDGNEVESAVSGNVLTINKSGDIVYVAQDDASIVGAIYQESSDAVLDNAVGYVRDDTFNEFEEGKSSLEMTVGETVTIQLQSRPTYELIETTTTYATDEYLSIGTDATAITIEALSRHDEKLDVVLNSNYTLEVIVHPQTYTVEDIGVKSSVFDFDVIADTYPAVVSGNDEIAAIVETLESADENDIFYLGGGVSLNGSLSWFAEDGVTSIDSLTEEELVSGNALAIDKTGTIYSVPTTFADVETKTVAGVIMEYNPEKPASTTTLLFKDDELVGETLDTKVGADTIVTLYATPYFNEVAGTGYNMETAVDGVDVTLSSDNVSYVINSSVETEALITYSIDGHDYSFTLNAVDDPYKVLESTEEMYTWEQLEAAAEDKGYILAVPDEDTYSDYVSQLGEGLYYIGGSLNENFTAMNWVDGTTTEIDHPVLYDENDEVISDPQFVPGYAIAIDNQGRYHYIPSDIAIQGAMICKGTANRFSTFNIQGTTGTTFSMPKGTVKYFEAYYSPLSTPLLPGVDFTVTSSKEDYLSISNNESSITAVAVSEDAITVNVTAPDEYNLDPLTYTITVTAPENSLAVISDETYAFTGQTVNFADNFTVVYADEAVEKQGIAFTVTDSLNRTIAETPTYKFTNTGTYKVTATLVADPEVTDWYVLYVEEAPVDSIKAEKASMTIVSGNSINMNNYFIVTVSPDNVSEAIEFSSSEPKVATIDSTGMLTAEAAGTTTVTATMSHAKLKATMTITVVKSGDTSKDFVKIGLDETTFYLGDEDVYSLLVDAFSVNDSEVKYKSSNYNVVSINEYGELIIKDEGTATLTAYLADSEDVKDSITVYVKRPTYNISTYFEPYSPSTNTAVTVHTMCYSPDLKRIITPEKITVSPYGSPAISVVSANGVWTVSSPNAGIYKILIEADDDLYGYQYYITELTIHKRATASDIKTYESIISNNEIYVAIESTKVPYRAGKNVRPDFEVYRGDQYLSEDDDYTVKLKNANKVGDAVATINFKNGITGKITIDYEIVAGDIEDSYALESNGKYYSVIGNTVFIPYDKKAHNKLTWKVYRYADDKIMTMPKKELELEVVSGDSALKEKGDYIISVTPKNDNMYGSLSYNVVVTDMALISSAKVKLEKSSFKYSGKEITPKVTVTIGKTTLKEDRDYTVEYLNNKYIGTAAVRISAVDGSKYVGSTLKTFKITGKYELSNNDIYVYDTVSDNYTNDEKVALTYDPVDKITGDYYIKLANGLYPSITKYAKASYKVSKGGKVTMTITGKGILKGKVTKTIDLQKFDVTNADASDFVALAQSVIPNKNKSDSWKKTPITFYNGDFKKIKIKAKEYDLIYTTSSNFSEKVGDYVNVSISFNNASDYYKGHYDTTYYIADKDSLMSKASAKVFGGEAQEYTGKYIVPTNKDIDVKLNGVYLSDNDFTIYKNIGNLKAGTASSIIYGVPEKGYYGYCMAKFKIKKVKAADIWREWVDEFRLTYDTYF